MIAPHVAILGAGPIGLDAALAVNEAGLPFTVYERSGDVAGNVRSWSHVRLFTPWSMSVSPRMRRALAAGGRQVPADDRCPSGAELIEQVLAPVASLPALAAHLRTGVEVLEVGRDGLLKNEEIGTGGRIHRPFRLVLRDAAGREWVESATVVLDCTGTYHHPNALGAGGVKAPGERAAEHSIVRRIPDVFGAEDDWADRRVLVVGGGHSAQTAAVDLAELARRRPLTEVTWALRSTDPDFGAVEDDVLQARARLVRAARDLTSPGSPVRVRLGVAVEALCSTPGGLEVTLASADGVEERLEVDRVVALTGATGDASLYRQLQVHECYATSGPMKLAAALLGSSSADCLAQTGHGVETLVNPEPGFFILGSKSYGRNNTFLLRIGWEQVDDMVGLVTAAAAAAQGAV